MPIKIPMHMPIHMSVYMSIHVSIRRVDAALTAFAEEAELTMLVLVYRRAYRHVPGHVP